LTSFELITGLNYYISLEKRVTILKELHSLSKEDVAAKPELRTIYDSAVADLAARDTKPLLIPVPSSFDPSLLVKVAMTILFWTLLAKISVANSRDKTAKRNTILGVSVMAVAGTIATSALPPLIHPILDAVGLQISLLAMLMLLSKKLPRPPSSKAAGAPASR
jgi:hypothetical protein